MRRFVINLILLALIAAGLCIALSVPAQSPYVAHVKDECEHTWVEKVQNSADTITVEAVSPSYSTLELRIPPEHEYTISKVLVCIWCAKEKIQILHKHNIGNGFINNYILTSTRKEGNLTNSTWTICRGDCVEYDGKNYWITDSCGVREKFDPVLEHSEIKK